MIYTPGNVRLELNIVSAAGVKLPPITPPATPPTVRIINNDGDFWDGAAFVSSAQDLALTLDADTGLYTYIDANLIAEDSYKANWISTESGGGYVPADFLEPFNIQTFVTLPAILAGITSDHGPGSYVGGLVSGSSQVTITVEDSGSAPIINTRVTVLNSGETTVLITGMTDSNGLFVFNIDDGTYSVRLAKQQVNFTPASNVLVVSGATPVTYVGDVLTIAPPVQSGTSKIIGFAPIQSDGGYQTEFDGTAEISSLPFNPNNSWFPGKKVPASYDAGSGLFSWILPHDAVVQFNMPDQGFTGRATIPQQAITDLDTLNFT